MACLSLFAFNGLSCLSFSGYFSWQSFWALNYCLIKNPPGPFSFVWVLLLFSFLSPAIWSVSSFLIWPLFCRLSLCFVFFHSSYCQGCSSPWPDQLNSLQMILWHLPGVCDPFLLLYVSYVVIVLFLHHVISDGTFLIKCYKWIPKTVCNIRCYYNILQRMWFSLHTIYKVVCVCLEQLLIAGAGIRDIDN